jgi:alkaline phosphatase D
MPKRLPIKVNWGKSLTPLKLNLNGLEIDSTYNYIILIDGKPVASSEVLKFTRKDLWQFRKPALDFSFLTGSCSYFNDPKYDRPGNHMEEILQFLKQWLKPRLLFIYGLVTIGICVKWIFIAPWGLNDRASRHRSQPVLQKLMTSMPQFAIWDDHDFGPNDAGKSYILKVESRKIFMNYRCNPSYGEEGKGIYIKISYSDVDIFMTDDRYFRSEDEMPDSTNGEPNKNKYYFGPMQMEWLKNALLFSNSTFKIVATRSQVLNPYSDFECMKYYSAEYMELMNFPASQKVRGVLFLTGDRHRNEIIKMTRKGLFPLYDITVSPYTSGIGKVKGAELNNPVRVAGTLVEEENFSKVTVTGKRNHRTFKS